MPRTYQDPTIDIFPSARIDTVSPLIFSGFIEHLGRCIYGGILPATRETFPYTPRKPCPKDQFTETPSNLLTSQGFRKDVLEVIRDEVAVPAMRWPGGNFVSSYHWEDGVGPLEGRKRRPELAWGFEESNVFGTDEFISWCREAKCEPYICLNMGTGTLSEALHWVEYCNGTGDTYYANLRRKHTGQDEPYKVKYWSLGNEVYGPWQVGQQTASAYATIAHQWAHAIKLFDPSVILVSCGLSGLDEWDGVVIDRLVDQVDLHSVHLYTGFGDRDRSQAEKEFGRSVHGPEAAEYALEIARGLINKARVAKRVSKPIKIAFDEYGVWDETVGTPHNGLEQFYNLTDALAMACWLNVFVRQADLVEMACIAQSVNVISPIITGPTGLFKQTIYYPLYLFSKYMRGGTSIKVEVDSPVFEGETLPTWISTIKGKPKLLDVSATLHPKALCVAVVNRSEDTTYTDVPLRIASWDAERVKVGRVEAHEIWHEDVKARNGWESKEEVAVKSSTEEWKGSWTFKKHSFTLLVIEF
ncbi:glycoside hydrolase family 51 protein [Jaapia argillacea MUCL 33604]|uniref:non-reducing end alpha-L-arabinofuranosidase n=1 Tax=Jaapia argillacea MUCL 33604 TaxID=933084 RepID=A0A067P4I2_9AGAM|nr:glycoside hydrolase family 51 protein [Jaapia argillacea MUCL 33604]